jgi:hypothetical protein
MSSATAFVFSADSELPTDESGSLAVVTSSSPLADCAAAALAKCVIGDNEFVILSDSAYWNPDALQAALAEFAGSAANIGVIPGDCSSDLAFVWQSLPSPIASLVMAPESRAAIVLRRSEFDATSFRDVNAPLHELIVRSSMTDPGSVALIGAFDTASALPAPAIALPEIAPQRPGRSARWLADFLKSPELHRALPTDSCDRTALLAGLWQVNDFLDESHSQSQSIEGEGRDRNGDYWHGIMHRREPDWWNSKYWFRRVGQHPCFDELGALAEQALNECSSAVATKWQDRCGTPGTWDATAFVDLCEKAATGQDRALAQAARRIQWAEMLLLLRNSL